MLRFFDRHAPTTLLALEVLGLDAVRRWAASVVLCALACATGGCQLAPDAELLELQAVEPQASSSDTWLLLGRGFPAGRSGRVRLVGKLHQPGEPSQPLELTVPCHAAADRRATFQLGEAPQLRGLGPGHFEGTLQVGFRAQAGDAEVTGRLPRVRLRLPATDSQSRRAQLRVNLQAKAWHRRLGLRDLMRAGGRKGVWVGQVQEGSLAEEAGLRPADVIRSVEGAPVEGPGDLVPPPGVLHAAVVVERGDVGEPLRLLLPTSSEAAQVRGPGWPLAAALLWLGAVAICSTPLRPAPQRRATRAAAWTRWLAAALCGTSVAALWMLRGSLDVATLWMAPALCSVAYSAVGFARGIGTGTQFAAHVTRLCTASLAVAAAALLHGDLHVPNTLLSEQAWPWQWTLACVPPAWFCVATAAMALGGRPPEQRVPQVLHGWLTWTAAVVLTASLGMGGQLPADMAVRFDWSAPLVSALSAAVWFAKVALLSLWLGRAARTLPQPAGLLWLGLTCPVLALSWLWLSPDPHWQFTLGVVAAGLVTVHSLRWLWAQGRRQALVRDPTLVPFL